MGEAGVQVEARVRGVEVDGGGCQARDGEGTKLVSLPHLPHMTLMSLNESLQGGLWKQVRIPPWAMLCHRGCALESLSLLLERSRCSGFVSTA